MKRLLIAAFILLATHMAVSQVRLEIAAHNEDGKSDKPMIVLAKGCKARVLDSEEKLDGMYILFADCGRTMFGVSPGEKSAVKMPMSNILSSPAPDIYTSVPFMQGTPQISIEKLEERPGPAMFDSATTYYKFRSVHRPDARVQGQVLLAVEEEFWTDATLDLPILNTLLGKAPFGKGHESEQAAFAVMKGSPLRHRTVVTVDKEGVRQSQPPFVQEVLSIKKEPFDETLVEIPKGFQIVDMEGNKQ